MSTPALKRIQPTLTEADKWFTDKVVPLRTASAGFSINRVWKGPLSFVKGNDEDPNGICGDAALFVFEEFYRQFGDYTTTDGYRIAMVLWQGAISNHIANVMLPAAKAGAQKFSWDTRSRALTCLSGVCRYNSHDLFALHVYDLYFKKSSSLEQWWRDRDSSMDGTLKLGMPTTIDD